MPVNSWFARSRYGFFQGNRSTRQPTACERLSLIRASIVGRRSPVNGS
jgi:hypothetical protein